MNAEVVFLKLEKSSQGAKKWNVCITEMRLYSWGRRPQAVFLGRFAARIAGESRR